MLFQAWSRQRLLLDFSSLFYLRHSVTSSFSRSFKRIFDLKDSSKKFTQMLSWLQTFNLKKLFLLKMTQVIHLRYQSIIQTISDLLSKNNYLSIFYQNQSSNFLVFCSGHGERGGSKTRPSPLKQRSGGGACLPIRIVAALVGRISTNRRGFQDTLLSCNNNEINSWFLIAQPLLRLPWETTR